MGHETKDDALTYSLEDVAEALTSPRLPHLDPLEHGIHSRLFIRLQPHERLLRLKLQQLLGGRRGGCRASHANIRDEKGEETGGKETRVQRHVPGGLYDGLTSVLYVYKQLLCGTTV